MSILESLSVYNLIGMINMFYYCITKPSRLNNVAFRLFNYEIMWFQLSSLTCCSIYFDGTYWLTFRGPINPELNLRMYKTAHDFRARVILVVRLSLRITTTTNLSKSSTKNVINWKWLQLCQDLYGNYGTSRLQ